MRRVVTVYLFALMTIMSLNVNAQRATSPEAEGAWMTATPLEVEVAILHILTAEPAHHLRKDAGARMALSEEIVRICEEKEIPPLFALSIIFRESSFDEKAVGLRGEFGLMQVAKGNVKRLQCDMTTTEGQIDCGTRMLQEAYGVCHTWGGALTRYATTTGVCKHDNVQVQNKVKLRLKDWQKFSAVVNRELYDPGNED